MGWFSDKTGIDLGGALNDYGSLAAGYLGYVAPIVAVAYEAYKLVKGKDDGGGGNDGSGNNESQLIAMMTESEAQAGQDAIYLRKQAMINNVL